MWISFFLVYHLRQHVKVVHQLIKDYKCEDCGKCFGQKSYLGLHEKIVHKKIRDNLCELCDFSSSSKFALRSHVKLAHLQIKNFPCEDCGVRCGAKSDLESHRKSVHENKKELLCLLCEKAFNVKAVLREHVKIVHHIQSRTTYVKFVSLDFPQTKIWLAILSQCIVKSGMKYAMNVGVDMLAEDLCWIIRREFMELELTPGKAVALEMKYLIISVLSTTSKAE